MNEKPTIRSNPVIIRETVVNIGEDGQAIANFPDIEADPRRFTGMTVSIFPDPMFKHRYTVVQALSLMPLEEIEAFERHMAAHLAEQLEQLDEDGD